MSVYFLSFIPSDFVKCNSCTCSSIEQYGKEFHFEKCIGRFSVTDLINKEFIDMKQVKGLDIFF